MQHAAVIDHLPHIRLFHK